MMSEQHAFEVEVAERHGVIAALLVWHFQFWIRKNRAEGQHLHNGRTWTYTTRRGLMGIFPYLSENQIRGAIDRLVKAEVIVAGNYNKMGFDQTKWYSFRDESLWLRPAEKANLKKPPMHTDESTNALVQNHQPIPDTKPDTKKDTPLPLKGGDGACEKTQDIFARKAAFDYYNEKARLAGVPEARGMGKQRTAHLRVTLKRIGGLEVWKQMVDKAMAIPGLTGAAANGWRIDFDTLLQEKTSTRILEGFYDRWGKPAETAAPPMNARERKYYEENLKKLREGQGVSQ